MPNLRRALASRPQLLHGPGAAVRRHWCLSFEARPVRDGHSCTAGAPVLVLRAGQHLCRSGDPITELWSVQQGVLKAYQISSGGAERVSAFYFAGDVIGWEALACGNFRHSVVALGSARVLPRLTSVVIDEALSSVQHQALMLDGMRAEFLRLESRLWFEHRPAGERLASFLLWLAHAQRHNGDAGRAVSLPMSRTDIASYLGLATETVSRRLAQFHRDGWIRLQRRCFWLLDAPSLDRLSEAETE